MSDTPERAAGEGVAVNGVNRHNLTGRIQSLVRKVMATSPRQLRGGYRLVTHVLAAAVAAFFVYTAGFGDVLGRKSSRALPGRDAGRSCSCGSRRETRRRATASPARRAARRRGGATAAYFIWEYPTMVRRAGLATPPDVTMGARRHPPRAGSGAARRRTGGAARRRRRAALRIARGRARTLPGSIAHSGFTAERVVTSVYMSARRAVRCRDLHVRHARVPLRDLWRVPGAVRRRPILHRAAVQP